MFRKYALAAMIAVGGLGAYSVPAGAVPAIMPHVDGSPVINVRDGCGRGWRLNPWGRCVPMRWHRPVYRHGWHGWHRPHYRHGWHHRPWHHRDYWRHHHHQRQWR